MTHPTTPRNVHLAGATYTTIVAGIAGSEPQLVLLEPSGESLAIYMRGNGSRPHSPHPSIASSADAGRTWSAARPSAVPAQGQLLTSIKAAAPSAGSAAGVIARGGPSAAARAVLYYSAPVGYNDVGVMWIHFSSLAAGTTNAVSSAVARGAPRSMRRADWRYFGFAVSKLWLQADAAREHDALPLRRSRCDVESACRRRIALARGRHAELSPRGAATSTSLWTVSHGFRNPIPIPPCARRVTCSTCRPCSLDVMGIGACCPIFCQCCDPIHVFRRTAASKWLATRCSCSGRTRQSPAT